MKLTRIIVPLAAAALFSTGVVAETEQGMIKCGGYNVRVGATKEDVRQKCGKPTSKSETEWHYHRETHKIQILYFEDGKVSRITAQKTAGMD